FTWSTLEVARHCLYQLAEIFSIRGGTQRQLLKRLEIVSTVFRSCPLNLNRNNELRSGLVPFLEIKGESDFLIHISDRFCREVTGIQDEKIVARTDFLF